jgi:hypothetical protein
MASESSSGIELSEVQLSSKLASHSSANGVEKPSVRAHRFICLS